MNMNDDELNEKDLENVVAGLYKRELAEDIALNNDKMYRKEKIDELKRIREELVNDKQERKKWFYKRRFNLLFCFLFIILIVTKYDIFFF